MYFWWRILLMYVKSNDTYMYHHRKLGSKYILKIKKNENCCEARKQKQTQKDLRYPRLQSVNKMKKQTNISSASWWSCPPICVNWNKLISSWSVIAMRSRSAYRKESSWSLEVISGMPCMLFGWKSDSYFYEKMTPKCVSWPLCVSIWPPDGTFHNLWLVCWQT